MTTDRLYREYTEWQLSDATGEYSEPEPSIDLIEIGEVIPRQIIRSDLTNIYKILVHKGSKQRPPSTPGDETLNSLKVGARPTGIGQNEKGAKTFPGIMITPACRRGDRTVQVNVPLLEKVAE